MPSKSAILTANQQAAISVLRTMDATRRDAAIIEARRCGCTLRQIAEAVGLSYSQVCRIVGKR